MLYDFSEQNILCFCTVLPILATWARVILLPQPHVGMHHHSWLSVFILYEDHFFDPLNYKGGSVLYCVVTVTDSPEGLEVCVNISEAGWSNSCATCLFLHSHA